MLAGTAHRDGVGLDLAPVDYQGWRGYRLRTGDVELILTPQVGGRIMSMCWRGYDVGV